MPAWVIPAITAAASLASTGANAYSTGKMNAKNRKFAEEMWKKDADQNIAQWDMQNKYNEGLWEKQKAYNQSIWEKENAYDSPSAQMDRLRQAGLNPNLIYGQNNMGGSLDAAQSTSSGNVPGKNTSPVQGKAPEFDLAQGIFAYMDFKTKSLSNDNLEAQNEAIRAATVRTKAETLATLSGIGLKDQLKAFRDEANPLGLDALRLKNRLSEQAHEKKEQYYQMDSERMNQWLKQSKAQIGRIVSQNMTDTKQRELMDTEINLNRMGIGKGSPWWLRAMGLQVQNSGLVDHVPDASKAKGPGIHIYDKPTKTGKKGRIQFPWDDDKDFSK